MATVKTTVDDMLKIMQAYKNGACIEYKLINEDESRFRPVDVPLWNWSKCDYRVVTDQKRPFKTASECFNEMKKHGEWLYCDGEYFQVISVFDHGVALCGHDEVVRFRFEEVATFSTWADGSYFGINSK